ncbi:MAG: prepilin-type N-terminal cleavage/methylation domain-containing protein [Deltaproteobacteria bacterium]|nr:prepilin-type N-terminal cleavage/methylation domain-containing protein [Deltaproteobacteria bacterium]
MGVNCGKGASLIEVLVALAVFAVGMGAFLPLLTASARAGHGATARSQAVARAKEKVDEIATLPFAHAASLGSGGEDLGGGFSLQWTPLSAPTLPGEEGDLARHLITVRWDLSGSSGSVELVSARGRY